MNERADDSSTSTTTPAATPGPPSSALSSSPVSAVLSPETLHGIAPLHLRARLVADALFAGGHRSRRFGSSTEFAEHKVYAPGDDLRRLDWRVMGRLDRSYVRRTEDETRTDVVVVVDTSNSMAYAGGARGAIGHSKLEVAKTLAASVAFIALHRQDAPGISLFAGSEQLYLPPRARGDAIEALTGALVSARADGKSSLAETLHKVGSRLRKRAVVVVISDMIDAGPDALDALGVLRRRGGDAIVLQVLHGDEVDFPFDGVVRFEDLEGDREVQVDAPLMRAAYLQELRTFLNDVEGACAKNSARYALCRADDNVVPVLAAALDDQPVRR